VPSTAPSLPPGTRLGPFEIVALVGAGGMGEVYRAADARLNRIVALKVLSESVAADSVRRRRFEREAEMASSLTHPHICAVYDVGRAQPEQRGSGSDAASGTPPDVDFLVMEYVEGETLESRLMGGALGLEDALRCAIDIASAVDYAHGRGILHRDLKPGNIMVTTTGVKLLDFGVAKATLSPGAEGGSNRRELPTQTLTEEGTILGTLNYMAPEQLEGGQTDGRADIFSIGAIIYEMVTGQRAFSGTSRASVIASVLRGDPAAPSVVRTTTPTALDRAILKCLAKDRQDRWQTARDLASELTWIHETRSAAWRVRRRSTSGRVRTALSALTLIAATSLTTLLVRDRWIDNRVFEPPASIQFAIQPPPGVSFLDSNSFMAVSPNGKAIVFVGSDARGVELLWVRLLDSLDARPLAGTEGARMPFWAPDNLRVGFVANEKLKTIDIQGRNLHTVCEIPKLLGASWGRDDVILIGSSFKDGGIRRVSAAGGRLTAVTTVDASRKEIAHNWPVFLPDGRHFLYRTKSEAEDSTGVFAASLDSSERSLILKADVNPDFALPGYLVTGTNGTLVAQPFNLSTFRLSGSPVVLTQPVRYNDSTGRTAVSASQGTLAYRQPEDTELRWFNRSGVALGLVGTAARYLDPELSPDGSHLAVARIDSDLGTSTISVIDLASGRIEPLTSGRTWDRSPVWSADGQSLVFSSLREGRFWFFQKTIGAAGAAEQVHRGATGIALDRTRDGTILSSREGALSLELATGEGVRPLTQSRAAERQARFSHDQRWMAYVSDESGTNEVYIRPASTGGSGQRISTGGGLQPRWRRDDRELFYLAHGGELMAVDLTITGADLHGGKPGLLFHTPLVPSVQFVSGRNQYDVSADGQRFIMNVPGASAPITVVSNWQTALHR